MAGVKGRSGGARPGAGRKPNKTSTTADTPLAFLLAVMRDVEQPLEARLKAAVSAAQYVHPKRGEGGKGEAKGAAAVEAGAGKFATAAPPKLVVNNRGGG